MAKLYIVPLFLLFLVPPFRQSFADLVYAVNQNSNDVSVLDATTLAPIAGSPFPTGGLSPIGIAINPTGTRVYVTNINSNNVSVLDATTLAPIVGSPFPTGGFGPSAIAINPAGTRVYIGNLTSNNLSVLDATTLAPIAGSPFPTGGTSSYGIVINPAGTRVYIANQGSFNVSSVSVLDATTLAPIAGSPFPTGGTSSYGIVITPQASTPSISPPSNLTGHQKRNDFGLVFELFNLLKWEASPSTGITGYFVYRDGIKIATLDASTLEYEDHNRKNGVTTLYSVTSFIGSNESTPINIEVK